MPTVDNDIGFSSLGAVSPAWRPIDAISSPDELAGRLLPRVAAIRALREKPLSTAPATASTPAAQPSSVTNLSATQEAYKSQGRTFSLVSVSFTLDSGKADGVRIWVAGYHGSPNPVLVADGTVSPTSFLLEATKETVTITAQAYRGSSIEDFGASPTTTVRLLGVNLAPPAPTVSQQLVAIPMGFQFTFEELAGLLADVIDSYRVYRNTQNNSATATLWRTYKHDPTNNGTIVVQDLTGGGQTYYYWVTSVNTTGLESAMTAAQPGATTSGTASLDTDVADGVTYARPVASDMTGNRIDFGKPLLNKQLDNIPDGSTYLRMPGSNMDSNRRALIDFSQGGHVNKTIDNVPDGANFVRALAGKRDVPGAGPLGWSPAAKTTDTSISYGGGGTVGGGTTALPTGVNATYCYARWTGYIVPTTTGLYTIGVNSDDGANLYVGGVPLVENLSTSQAAASGTAYSQSGTIYLQSGVYYPIVLEWQQGSGGYNLQLLWTPPGGSVGLIPSANLTTSRSSITGNLAGTWWNGNGSVWYPTGTHYIDFLGPHANKQLDNIPDGSTYLRMPGANMDSNRRALIDFTQTGHVGKTLDNVPDGSKRFGVINGSGMNAVSAVDANNKALIDFSQSGHLNKTLDNVNDGTTYVRSPVQAGSAISIDNADFSAGTAGWVADSGVYMAPSQLSPFSSGTSLIISNCAQNYGVGSIKRFKVRPGDTITLDCWLVSDGTFAINCSMEMLNGQGGLVASDTPRVGPVTSVAWQHVTATAVVPANATQTYVKIWRSDSGGSSAFAYATGIRAVRLSSLDSDVIDGSTYLRSSNANFASVGMLPTSGGYLTASYVSSTGTSTISVASWTAIYPGTGVGNNKSVTYNSGSITGLANSTTYYVYCDDPSQAGGAVTYYATTNPYTCVALGRVYVGKITTPAPGGGGTSGGGGGGGGGTL